MSRADRRRLDAKLRKKLGKTTGELLDQAARELMDIHAKYKDAMRRLDLAGELLGEDFNYVMGFGKRQLPLAGKIAVRFTETAMPGADHAGFTRVHAIE